MPATVVCANCGVSFSCSPSKAIRRKNCSRRCAGSGIWRADEIEWLRRFYGAAGGRAIDLCIAEVRLKRLRSNICRKARELGLGLTDQHRPTYGGQLGLPLNETRLPPEMLTERRAERQRRQFGRQGHPRGMLGKKHSRETLELLADKSRMRWADPESALNSEHAAQLRSDHLVKRLRQPGSQMNNGYSRCRRGHRADLGGQFFRSAWEANYARYLSWQRSRGAISGWRYEARRFEFPDRRGARSYLPDFEVTMPDGLVEWHEVKGWLDGPSKTRLKRFAKHYPDQRLVLIDAAWFKSNGNLRQIVPHWE